LHLNDFLFERHVPGRTGGQRRAAQLRFALFTFDKEKSRRSAS
jgi:hypothetical protein